MNLLSKNIFKEPKKLLIPTAIVLGLIIVLTTNLFNFTGVSAQIIPVSVNITHLAFGTVFPGEELQGNFIVTYGTTGNGIHYKIIQKPKPCPQENPTCGPAGYYRDLCPFLKKVNVDAGESDTVTQAFVGPNDLTDTWIVYFKVPPIMGHVSQDYIGGVVTDEGDYGCDIAIDINLEELCNSNEELVLNGGFESPIVTAPQKWDIYDSGTSSFGWMVEWYDGATSYNGQTRPEPAHLELHRGVMGWLSHGTSSQHAELDTDWDGPSGSLSGEPASVRIYQDIPTLPGQTYNIKFYFSPRPATDATNNILEFSWGGEVKATTTAAGGSNTIWTEHSYNFSAIATTTRLQFTDLGTPDSLGPFLDDVSVRCIP